MLACVPRDRRVSFRGPAAALLLAAAIPTFALAQGAPDGKAPATPSTAANINPTGRDVTIVVPLHGYGPLGQVQITITAKGAIFISARDLFNALSRIVRPDNLKPLKDLVDSKGQISLAATARAGFPVTYDSNAIELNIEIPALTQNTQDVSLGVGTENAETQPDMSASLAVFLNYRVGEAYQFSGGEKGDPRFLGDFELGGRIAQTLSFDNFASVDQGAPNPFVRSASRLIYDMPDSALRITAGDLVTETTGFQTDPQISGLNVNHLFSDFFPGFSTNSSANQSVTLAHASDVQILVNNMPVADLHLGPGAYNLRNLPIAQGANNMTAIITDDSGQRRVVNFSFFSDINLLSPGLDEYTASLGILAPLDQNGPRYETNEPAFSGFYRRGLTQQLTAGINIQAARYDQLLGISGVYGTDYGLFGLDLAANHLQTGGSGGALRFQYRYADQSSSLYFARTVDLSAEFRTERFADINTLNPDNSDEATFAASINQPITESISLQLSGNYTKSRGEGLDTGAVSSFVTWQAPFDTTLSGGATYQWAPRTIINGEDLTGRGFSLAISLTHRFDETSLADASADRFQQHADFSRSPVNPIDDWFANGDFTHNQFGYTGDATAGYETNHGNIEGAYNTSLNSDGSLASQQVGLFFDGSVDFAGGNVALGPHVTDSFAIVDGDPSLQGRQVIVDSQFANQVVARSDALGPAVVPTASYNKQAIPYDVKDLPPGYDLGSGNFQIYPWFHSGFALTVGSPYNVTALGNLLDQDGQPLALETGVATSLTDPKAPHREVITNRSGRFAAIGLSPGNWRIVMSGGLTYDITITKEEGMLVRFGVLKPDAGHVGGKP